MKVTLFAAFLTLLPASALAAQIDFSSPIRGLDGETIRQCDADTDKCKAPTTLAIVSATALLAPDDPRKPQDQTSGEEKAKRFAIALKIHAGGKVDLTVEEIALLKRLIGAGYAPLVVGRANELLDPPAKP